MYAMYYSNNAACIILISLTELNPDVNYFEIT